MHDPDAHDSVEVAVAEGECGRIAEADLVPGVTAKRFRGSGHVDVGANGLTHDLTRGFKVADTNAAFDDRILHLHDAQRTLARRNDFTARIEAIGARRRGPPIDRDECSGWHGTRGAGGRRPR